MKNSILTAILIMVGMLLGCQKEHNKYRFTPKFHVGQLVQFEKSIEHDNAEAGKHMWDIPQPLRIDSFFYNDRWRDNWYFVTDANGDKYGASIDELSLQEWNGRLQK